MKTSKDRYADYLQTDYWKAVEREVKKRAGYRCQICNSQHDLQAHHRTYENRGKELNYLDDLTCLCRRCHAVFHGALPMPLAPVPQPVKPVITPHPIGLSKKQRKESRVAEAAKFTNVRPHTQAQIDAEMPPGDDTIILTKELVDRCRVNGAFTTATVEGLGVATKMWKGWTERLVGETISRLHYRQALEGKYIYTKSRFKVEQE